MKESLVASGINLIGILLMLPFILMDNSNVFIAFILGMNAGQLFENLMIYFSGKELK